MNNPILHSYSAHGSVSYGPLTADRLEAILRGSEPSESELVRVDQALMEIPGAYAYDLAVELGFQYSDLNARARALLGKDLPL